MPTSPDENTYVITIYKRTQKDNNFPAKILLGCKRSQIGWADFEDNELSWEFWGGNYGDDDKHAYIEIPQKSVQIEGRWKSAPALTSVNLVCQRGNSVNTGYALGLGLGMGYMCVGYGFYVCRVWVLCV